MARPIYEIARDIRKDWKNVYFGAVPYLQAMNQLDSIRDDYGADSGDMIVRYFLANAKGWRGDVAKAIKAELNAMLKGRAGSNLRGQIIRLAATLPTGSEERRLLLSALEVEAAHPLDRARRHQLMPANVRSKIPKLYSQEDVEDPIVQVKFFSPYTNATWLVTEFDGRDTMFGWADLGMGGGELGYISLSELEGLEKRGLPLVERDLYWKPKPLSEAKRD